MPKGCFVCENKHLSTDALLSMLIAPGAMIFVCNDCALWFKTIIASVYCQTCGNEMVSCACMDDGKD